MKEIVRLVDGDATAAQRLLLKAAQAHRPPDDQARARTAAAAAALVVASAAVVGSGKVVGAGAASRMLSSALLKWWAIVTLGGGVGVGGVLVARHVAKSTLVAVETSPPAAVASPPSHEQAPMMQPLSPSMDPIQTQSSSALSPVPPSAVAAPPAVTPRLPAVLADPPAPALLPSVSVASASASPTMAHDVTPPSGGGGIASSAGPTQSREGAPEVAPIVPAASSLPAEVRLLDEARGSLSAHEPAKAIATLDRYDTAFPGGVLRPEARVLRIQALLDAGDRASATRLADELFRVDPSGPYAQRVRKMIGAQGTNR
jgi:hypothetical protein